MSDKKLTKKMIINVDDDETRVAIIMDNTLHNLDVEQTYHNRNVGNVYKGVVVKTQTSFQAAFVDYGAEKHGFLALSDVNPRLFRHSGGHRRERPSISRLLKPGQEVMVQVIRDEVGHKGASLSTNITLPGRFIVFMPNSDRGGVSKKIDDSETRSRLKHLLEGLCGEDDSAIIRTAGVNQSLSELKRDFMMLRRQWNEIQDNFEKRDNPGQIFQEESVVVRTLRDYFTDDIEEVWIDNPEAFQQAREFFKTRIPKKQRRLHLYLGDRPLFSEYEIESQIEQLSSNQAPLPSGGSLVIDPTEALVAIDVNSGRSNQERSIEDTALRTNVEAAEEIARQLRLRNLGGLIVIDFIDMQNEKNRNLVVQTLEQSLQEDKAKWTLSPISQFGLLEMSRQRADNSLSKGTKVTCPTCGGTGTVLSIPSLANAVLRKIRELAATDDIVEVHSKIPVGLANYLFNRKRQKLDELELEFNIRIFLEIDNSVEFGKLSDFYVRLKGSEELSPVEENKVYKNGKREEEEPVKKTRGRKRERTRKKPQPIEPTSSNDSVDQGDSGYVEETESIEVTDNGDNTETVALYDNEQQAELETSEADEIELEADTQSEIAPPQETPSYVPPLVDKNKETESSPEKGVLFASVHQPPPPDAVPSPPPKAPAVRGGSKRELAQSVPPNTTIYMSHHRQPLDDNESEVEEAVEKITEPEVVADSSTEAVSDAPLETQPEVLEIQPDAANSPETETPESAEAPAEAQAEVPTAGESLEETPPAETEAKAAPKKRAPRKTTTKAKTTTRTSKAKSTAKSTAAKTTRSKSAETKPIRAKSTKTAAKSTSTRRKTKKQEAAPTVEAPELTSSEASHSEAVVDVAVPVEAPPLENPSVETPPAEPKVQQESSAVSTAPPSEAADAVSETSASADSESPEIEAVAGETPEAPKKAPAKRTTKRKTTPRKTAPKRKPASAKQKATTSEA